MSRDVCSVSYQFVRETNLSSGSMMVLYLANVEKSLERRSHPFAVLTYFMYAPRVKTAAALPVAKDVLASLGLGG